MMIDRKNTGRISEERRVHKRSRAEKVEEKQSSEIDDKYAKQREEMTAALATLNLPDFDISEITAIEKIEVGDQTVIQLKNGDFVKYAMVDGQETSPGTTPRTTS